MSQRMERVNKHLQRTVGEILQRRTDLPRDVLVTVSYVDTTPNLRSATVWLYVQPLERAEETLERLNGQIYELQGDLNQMLDLKPLPRIRLRIDYGAEHAEHIDQAFRRLEGEDEEQ